LIGTEKVKVRLSEKAIRSERELTAEENKKPAHTISNRWVYSPSGKLTFEINEYCNETPRGTGRADGWVRVRTEVERHGTFRARLRYPELNIAVVVARVRPKALEI
jgi:hypothetical protein